MLGARAWSWQFLFAVLATGSAMIVEGPKHAQLDDDLLMLVVPLSVLTLAVLIFQPPMLPQNLELPESTGADLHVAPPFPHPSVRDADPVVRPDASDLLLPPADRALRPLVADGLCG